jgi:hypothetical protein
MTRRFQPTLACIPWPQRERRGKGHAMELSATGWLGQLKGMVTRMGTQGVRVVVDSTTAAVRVVDEFQSLLAKQRRQRMKRESAQAVGSETLWEQEPRATPTGATVPRERVRATAERVLAEVRAAEERIREARPARRPLKVQAEADTVAEPARRPRKTARTTGRKTMASATAPKRATAKDGFKARRGQKHRH